MEDLMNEVAVKKQTSSIITVIGVGGAGGNALNYMWNMGIKDVNFLACNTDQGALDNLDIPDHNKIVMGPGLGAGNDPERGRELAMEALDSIREHLEANKTKMVFIAAGMGGGTGTGASPVIAKLAHEMGLLTVANVTSPLLWEGPTRCEQAARGIEELRKYADSLLVINNESIREMYGKLPVTKAFGKADDILASATKGIAELITVKTAFIRVDFADLERVMRGSGRAHMGVAQAEGEGRALEAARRSLCSPLLNSNLISGAKKILLNVAAASIDDISYDEAMEVLNYIQSYASYQDEDGVAHQADVIWGVSAKPMPAGALEVVVVATGFSDDDLTKSRTFPTVAELIELMPEKEDVVTTPSTPLAKPVETKTIEPNVQEAGAKLGRTPTKFANLDADKRVPAFRRRNIGMIDNNTSSARKENFRMEPEEDNGATNGSLLFQ